MCFRSERLYCKEFEIVDMEKVPVLITIKHRANVPDEDFVVEMSPSDFEAVDLEDIFNTVCSVKTLHRLEEKDWFDLEIHYPTETQWSNGNLYYAHIIAHVYLSV
jgi:hypothetical protein